MRVRRYNIQQRDSLSNGFVAMAMGSYISERDVAEIAISHETRSA